MRIRHIFLFLLLFFGNYGFGGEMKRLQDQVVIVTGASKGIGREMAKVFSCEGAKLVLVARNEMQLKELSDQIENSIYVTADVSKEGDMEKVAEAAIEKWGKIDVLVANAGICLEMRLEEMTLEQWQKTIDVDLTGVFLSLKSVIPAMKKQNKGKVVITSSVTGPVVAMPGFSHYGAAKSGISGFVRTAAIELAKYYINVNCIEPGNIISEGMLALGDEHTQQHLRAIPWGRLGTGEEVAFLALFLASKESDYITGQGIVIDGGQTLPESHFIPY
ncbi:MAG: SDR family oxidoreductase [Parachlamydiaceae bacterium]|nr:SDR family oxidoreductase [Parachlamydiaceae bacterium]